MSAVISKHGIEYRSFRPYKYQLLEDYVFDVGIKARPAVVTKFVELGPKGKLLVKTGYAWDGPSGLTIDTDTFMRGSLVHDALYQLMQMGLISWKNRKLADKWLVRICKEDGMCWIRRRWVYAAVRLLGRCWRTKGHDDNV